MSVAQLLSCLVEMVGSLFGQPLRVSLLINMHKEPRAITMTIAIWHITLQPNYYDVAIYTWGHLIPCPRILLDLYVNAYTSRHNLKNGMHFYPLKEKLILHVIHLFDTELHAIT